MRDGLLDLLIAVAASSGLSSLIVAFMTRGETKSKKKKVDMDSTQVAVDIWKDTAEGLDTKLDKVNKEKDDLYEEVVQLRKELRELRRHRGR